MADRPIRIAGGGLSGLSAAITLARAGRGVEVYEKGPACGAARHGDIEGLETWIFPEDPLEYLRAQQLPVDFATKAAERFAYLSSDGEKIEAEESQPLFYLVRRGPGESTIDNAFYQAAVAAGVTFHFRSRRVPDEVDIYAGGPLRADAYVIGATLSVEGREDGIILLLGDDAAPGGYAYGLCWSGAVTVATAFRKNGNPPHAFLKRVLSRFDQELGWNVANAQPFASYGTFGPVPELQRNGTLLVGEAAGLQDGLFGFGMNYAIRSGILAAQSILEGGNYAEACRRHFGGRLASGTINRLRFERLSDGLKERLAVTLLERKAVLSALRRASQPSWTKSLQVKARHFITR